MAKSKRKTHLKIIRSKSPHSKGGRHDSFGGILPDSPLKAKAIGKRLSSSSMHRDFLFFHYSHNFVNILREIDLYY